MRRNTFNWIANWAAQKTIRFYQKFFSPVLGNHCRFYPSCSEYAREAFKQEGFLKAFLLAVIRIVKCHPFSRGGYDPLPACSHEAGR